MLWNDKKKQIKLIYYICQMNVCCAWLINLSVFLNQNLLFWISFLLCKIIIIKNYFIESASDEFLNLGAKKLGMSSKC